MRYRSLHRVSLDKAGQVLSCEVVSEVGDPAPRTYFVHAVNEGKAIQYARRRRVRDEAVAAKKPVAASVVPHREKPAPTVALKPLPLPPVTSTPRGARVAAQTPQLGYGARAARCELLEEVREQFLSIPTMRQFGLWLNEQIAAVTDKPPPKLRMVGK